MSIEQITITFHPDDRTTYNYSLPDVVKISDDMSKDLREQAGKYLWFASLAARLVAKRDNISNHLKQLLASTEIHYRKLAEVNGDKTTEAKIKALVEADMEVNKVKGFLSDAEAELSICYSIRDSFSQRKDMLVALGANWRAELNAYNPDSLRNHGN